MAKHCDLHIFKAADRPFEEHGDYCFLSSLDFDIYLNTSFISSDFLESWVLKIRVWDGYGDWTEPSPMTFTAPRELKDMWTL